MNKKDKARNFLAKQWKQWRWLAFLIVFVIIPVKSSLADWNWVPTGSMNPTIVEGDMVYVNKLAYDLRVPLTLARITRWSDPQAGDIVVLFSPADGIRLVKRVIGVPGDEIEMRNNVLLRNGKQLAYSSLTLDKARDLPIQLRLMAEFYSENLNGVQHAVMSLPGVQSNLRDLAKFVVPDGQYFVMGDNRDNSKDSRYFGFADRDSIIGQATGVILSVDKTNSWKPRFRRFLTKLN